MIRARRAIPPLLLVLAALALAGEDGRWLDSLDAAKSRARRAGKPVLVVLLRKGHAESRRLERDLAKNAKIGALLDSFVCAKLDYDREDGLIRKFGLRYAPATLFLTSIGSPMKVVVGPVSSGKYLSQMKAALEKHESIWNPKRPSRPTGPEEKHNPSPERKVPMLRHPGGCPDACPFCGPAVSAALDWLAHRQEKDGRWRKPRAERVTKTDDGRILTRSIDVIDVALTSTAGLAFLADGSTPTGGRYRREVARAVSFVAGAVREDGIACAERGNDYTFLVHANFETSLAAMFLAEALAADPDPALRAKVARIGKYLASVQDPRTGAWGYSYDFLEHSMWEKRGWRLLATTYAVMTALESIRDAGVPVDPAVLERGARYILTCRGRDGAFVYRAELRRQKGHPGMTAGALFALARSRAVPAADLAPIRARWRRHFDGFEEFGQHWWWFLLFTGLAMNDAGLGSLDAFDETFRDVLLADRKEDGHWDEPDGNGGSVFSTSVAAIALSLRKGRLKILGRTGRAAPIDVVRKPDYLKPPHPQSRVKVFPHRGGYRVDLQVAIDGPVSEEYVRTLREGILGANRKLYDVTDGQMCMNRVEILPERGKWDTADIRITREFYDAEENPHPFAHGITRVSRRTDLVGGRERARKRIGDYILFPWAGRDTEDVIRWDQPAYVHVLAHELCHYLFGLRDEYHTRTGESFCDCIMGKRRATELCTEATHTDDRQDADCFSLAKGLYPNLEIPETPDPGPWDPPVPEVEVVR